MESQIKNLQKKYWEGNSSVEEEQLLKQLLKKENRTDAESAFFKEIAKQQSIKSKLVFPHPKKQNKILWQLTTVAATIAILIALTIGFNTSNNTNQFTIDDPQQAYEISQQALLLVSSKLNKGKTYSSKMDKINEVKNMVLE